MTQKKRVTYTHRNPPPAYSPDWMRTEFGNLERAIGGADPSSTAAYSLSLTATYTAPAENAFYAVALPSGSQFFNLPSAAACPGFTITVIKVDLTANTLTVETIDTGNATLSSQYQSITVRSDGVSSWYKIAST